MSSIKIILACDCLDKNKEEIYFDSLLNIIKIFWTFLVSVFKIIKKDLIVSYILEEFNKIYIK
jgi:hypothetical protein